MATKKASELDDAGTLAGTEIIAVVKGGTSKRTTSQQIANTATALGETVTTGTLRPVTDGGYGLGTISYRYSGLFLSSGAVVTYGDSNYTVTHSAGLLTFSGAVTVTGNVTVGSSKLSIVAASGNVDSAGSVLSSSASAGMGYKAGAGAAVTQITSRTTGVTINAVCGAITLVSAAGSTTPASFTVTNSAVAATDVVHVCQKSGTDKYVVLVTNVAAGSFVVTFYTTGGTTTEQPVFSFAVIKAVAA